MRSIRWPGTLGEVRRYLLALALLGALFLVALNGLVRLAGGEPHLLSPRFVPEKVKALSLLVAHGPAHLFGSCAIDQERVLTRLAKRHRLPPNFVLSIARAESRLGAHRISHAGAMGLMQLSPARAHDLGIEDPFDAGANAEAGVRHLAWLWQRYGGDRRRVTAAYNAGPGAVPKKGPLRLPGETQVYLTRVLGKS